MTWAGLIVVVIAIVFLWCAWRAPLVPDRAGEDRTL